MIINKKTWCAQKGCNGDVERRESVHLLNAWSAIKIVSYVCNACLKETIVDLGMNSKQRKKLAKEIRRRK